jgi:hypothetical protein
MGTQGHGVNSVTSHMVRSRVSLAASVGWAGLVFALGGSAPWRCGAAVLADRMDLRPRRCRGCGTPPNGPEPWRKFAIAAPVARGSLSIIHGTACSCLCLYAEGLNFTAETHLKIRGVKVYDSFRVGEFRRCATLFEGQRRIFYWKE